MNTFSILTSPSLRLAFAACALSLSIPASGCIVLSEDSESSPAEGSEGGPNAAGEQEWPGAWPNDDEDEDSENPKQNIRFTFDIPGADAPARARVVNGKSIVIDSFPKSYGFKLKFGPAVGSIARKIKKGYCEEVEGFVQEIEDQGDDANKALVTLRESHEPEMISLWFGEFFMMQMLNEAREAARSAGSSSSGLRIDNAPKYKDLSFELTFDRDSLTRRVGGHEKAKRDFQDQFKESLPLRAPGLFTLDSSWADLVCDLYQGQAQIKVSMKEKGWATTAESQGFK